MNQGAGIFAAGAVALGIASGAWGARSLTASGAFAAFMIGFTALRVSWAWGVFLIAWFVLASLLSRLGKATKSGRIDGIVMKGDRRDAFQVLANGGVFLFAAFAVIFVTPHISHSAEWNALLAASAAGALAAAGADTWATEIGTMCGSAPWSLRTRRRVPAGTSGAITVVGTSALVAGGVLIAILAAMFGVIPADLPSIVAVGAGGVVGALADTAIGAWLQERRHCSVCNLDTEQIVHVCGNHAKRIAGVASLDNDVVNALCTLIGATTAALLTLGCKR
ncbi:MAG: DUF92 domain-containing protein [Gemmatimonadaceae bacterium]